MMSTQEMMEALKLSEPTSIDILKLLEWRVSTSSLTDFTSTVAVLEAAMAWIIAIAPAGREAAGLDLAAAHLMERKEQFEKRGYLDEVAMRKRADAGQIARELMLRRRTGEV